MWSTDLYKSFMLRKEIGRHGGLRFLIMYVLSNGPKNGAEIMDEVEKLSHGWWRPSPGSVYPLLSAMVSEGLLEKMGDRKYRLTKEGERKAKEFAELIHRHELSISDMLDSIENYISYFEDLGADKLAPYRDRLEKINKRVEALLK